MTGIKQENAESVRRIQAAQPWLEDLVPARDAIPALRERRLFDRGPHYDAGVKPQLAACRPVARPGTRHARSTGRPLAEEPR